MSRGVLTTPPTQIGTLRRGRLSYSGNCCRFLKFRNLSRFVHQRPRAVFAEAEESRTTCSSSRTRELRGLFKLAVTCSKVFPKRADSENLCDAARIAGRCKPKRGTEL